TGDVPAGGARARRDLLRGGRGPLVWYGRCSMGSRGAAMTPAFSKIVVPTDFRDHAAPALAYAESLATGPGASLRFVHVADLPALPTIWSTEIYMSDLPTLQAEEVEDAERRMEMHRLELGSRGLQVTTEVLIGQTVRAITEFASRVGADLVVMGTHGRTGLAH